MEAEIRWLDDPQVFAVNRLSAHSDHRFYGSRAEYEAKNEGLRQSLNGQWQFHWSKNAAERPADFYKESFDWSGFDTIEVPGHIELAGYDRIHYINTMYPWEGHLYRRPAHTLEENGEAKGQFSEAAYNPVGSYVREFVLEEGLRDKRVSVVFYGAEQAIFVWLNGQFVGYGEDSFTPSEFDLTPFLRDGKNVIAVEVHKRSTAAYLEDQDFFRFSGLFRDVELVAKPRVHAEDVWARAELGEDLTTGTFSLELKLSAEGAIPAGSDISWKIFDQTEHCVAEGSAPAASSVKTARCEIPQVHIWDNHNPYLYRLEITIFDFAGNVVEFIPCELGFRRIEIKDKVIYLNGKRLIINGVNRHEWNARRGRAITMEDMERDMAVIKASNINSVRTCHYPDQLAWYAMCDREGIYLMAETNLESHGSWQKMGAIEPSWNVPGNYPAWREAVLDRARSNFETFKNHVSVLFWSLGNESYAGDDIQAMGEFFKEKDPGRLVHYEGVVNNRAYADRISDVESRMYAWPKDVREYLRTDASKPFILCEYMHDMGNSLGGLKSYMDLLDKFASYQGGYIWDFIDQALYVKDEVTGKEVLRYGGDFDDRPSDYEFSGNGILFADRTPKPALQEVRYYYGLYDRKSE